MTVGLGRGVVLGRSVFVEGVTGFGVVSVVGRGGRSVEIMVNC